jgi:hypothetical protein
VLSLQALIRLNASFITTLISLRSAPEIADFNPSLKLVVDDPEIIILRQSDEIHEQPETTALKVIQSDCCLLFLNQCGEWFSLPA